jgi:transposase
MGNCAGIDWASEKHDVLIAGPDGSELLGATFTHDEDGIGALCAALGCFDVEVVAIERPEGLLVDRLLDAGIAVLALHPNQVKAARDRFRASGGKSDRFDCFVLCELARTDAHRFRILEPDLDATKALRALTRAREDLVAARVSMANQLRAELERFWPGPIGLFHDLDSQISLAFLARYPSPEDARLLGEKRLAAFLRAHNYNNRKAPKQLLARLRTAATGRAGESEIRSR